MYFFLKKLPKVKMLKVYALECLHSSRSMLLVVYDQKHTPGKHTLKSILETI